MKEKYYPITIALKSGAVFRLYLSSEQCDVLIDLLGEKDYKRYKRSPEYITLYMGGEKALLFPRSELAYAYKGDDKKSDLYSNNKNKGQHTGTVYPVEKE